MKRKVVDQIVSSINTLSAQNSQTKRQIINEVAQGLNTPLCSGSSTGTLSTGSVTLANPTQANSGSFYAAFQKAIDPLEEAITLVSMNAFNALVTDAVSFNINKVQTNRTGFSFEFQAAAANQWNSMRLNFITTSRPDIELGTLTYDVSLPSSTPGYLSYRLQKNWPNP